MTRGQMRELAAALGVLGVMRAHTKHDLFEMCRARALVLAQRCVAHEWAGGIVCQRCRMNAHHLASLLPAEVLIQVARAAGPALEAERAC